MGHIIHIEDDQNRRRNVKNFNVKQQGLRALLVLDQMFSDAPSSVKFSMHRAYFLSKTDLFYHFMKLKWK